jgi:hypothetical protein
LMEKKLNSIRIDDTIMVQNNIVLEPIRWGLWLFIIFNIIEIISFFFC